MSAPASGFIVEIEGKALPDDVAALLVSGVVDSSLRLPDLFALRFRDPDRSVIAKSGIEIGKKIVIKVAVDSSQDPAQLLSGEVTALEVEVDPTGTFTTIRGYDQAHRLFRARRTASYTQVTASDAATQIAQRAKLPAGNIKSTSAVFPHLSQSGQTDWEFLDGLARQIGYEVAVRNGKLDFCPRAEAAGAPKSTGKQDNNPLVLRLGTDLLRLRSVLTAAEQVGKVEVRGWDVAQKRAIIGTTPAGTTSVDLPTVKPADMAKAFGDPTYVATDIAYRTQPEADSAAKALAERIGSSFAEVEAVARGNPKLKANIAITLDNVGVPFDGKYMITSARHRYDPAAGGYTTSFGVTGRQERSLYGLTSGGQAGNRGQAGVVVAQVSDASDPSQQGRVKLTFPWLSADYVSDWARTLQPGAGKNRGAMVLPEVGDEVLVAFEQGDPGRPYVLGGLFNGVDTPNTLGINAIDGNSGAVNRRSLISRQGHRIDLLDDHGKDDGITIATGDSKQKIEINAAATTITVHSDGSVTIEGKKGITLDAAASKLELKASQITLDAKRGVKIAGGGGDVEVSSSTSVAVTGTAIKVSARGTGEVKATGPLIVSGLPVKIN